MSATEITNLLYRYAELMDAGEFASVAALFEHAKIRLKDKDSLIDNDELLNVWRNYVKTYSCGTPRTKHLITNPIVEVDNVMGSATCRSYYTVLQAADNLPLQVIAAGRYYDEFVRVDGRWRFSYRDYSLFDLKGNLSSHLTHALGI